MVWRCLVLLALVYGEPCQERLADEPVVQFTAEACTCCYDLDEFIQDNDYVYVLFYSPKGRLNIDISAKFEQLAREWKWSRIHFGRIDVDKDRAMSKRWVESNMVPTNVMYKYGRPVEVKPKDFEVIRDKYQGSPDGQKWMLTKYMGEDAQGPVLQGSNLHYATVLPSVKTYKKFLKGHQVSIVGYFKREADREHKAFMEAIWRLFQGEDADRDEIVAVAAVAFLPDIMKQAGVTAPSLELYMHGKAISQGATPDKWSVKAVVDFIQQFNVLNEPDADAPKGEL
ncbi:unnamed protein product [Effrenium voratum]|uniref:Thioredoxin-like fold domain-containing protein n=1 Tax=Effrenium voratum TaxID=2562239 RepID=A0AA36MWR6_9DINO|nr:unnamed protein product [Effrenium voratum]